MRAFVTKYLIRLSIYLLSYSKGLMNSHFPRRIMFSYGRCLFRRSHCLRSDSARPSGWRLCPPDSLCPSLSSALHSGSSLRPSSRISHPFKEPCFLSQKWSETSTRMPGAFSAFWGAIAPKLPQWTELMNVCSGEYMYRRPCVCVRT